MPVKISVGPPVLTINHGSLFMVTDLNGEIATDSELGVFADDTRYLSAYVIFVNGLPWTRLASSPTAYYAARVYLTNPAFETPDGPVEEGTVALTIARSVGEGIHEDLDLTNYGLSLVRFKLEIALRSDFADIFDVRSHTFVRRGLVQTDWVEESTELVNRYAYHDFERSFTYRLAKCTSTPVYSNGRVVFDIALAPGASWHSCCLYVIGEGDRVREPNHGCYHQLGDAHIEDLQQLWLSCAPPFQSSNEDVNRLYRQAIEDLGALRLYEYDFAPDVWLPAAGVPWFVTIFGRDSLVSSLQCMSIHTGFARGALKRLAQLQATEMDDWRDAEPGKIPHEIRFGELAYFKQIPHTPYYGSADGTALYLTVLHEAWKWTGDEGLLREYRDVAMRCLEWIDRHGDRDGDGFQEYATRSVQGYENQGWKDAGDAIVYPDGSQVEAPKALCELQGYVFDAWMRMAEVFDALGDRSAASELRGKAARLQQRFEEAFWMEDLGFYAFTLDPNKQPVGTVASNPGHCLWSGICRPDRAASVVKRLLESDVWSGWGIRTLSAENPAYNPFSYQRGSVWPHDNGIIAMGFKRYGFSAEAAMIARDICQAATYFVSYRLPELYAGVARAPGTFPVLYPEANVPQAWAAGTVFQLLQALLGLRADAPRKRLYVDPLLPEWLPDLTISNIAVGPSTVALRVWREAGKTRWDATVSGDLSIEQEPWQPWQVPKATAVG